MEAGAVLLRLWCAVPVLLCAAATLRSPRFTQNHAYARSPCIQQRCASVCLRIDVSGPGYYVGLIVIWCSNRRSQLYARDEGARSRAAGVPRSGGIFALCSERREERD